ncbi:hypothetical protein JB92DRAFT_3115543 [Gautieria morchelliformis]|nr:hypothetical protein JB92DRAFT_3115543 [Gautieria morchelliformis]
MDVQTAIRLVADGRQDAFGVVQSALEQVPNILGGSFANEEADEQLPKQHSRYDLMLPVGEDIEKTASVVSKGCDVMVSWNDLIFDNVPHGSFQLRVDVYQHHAFKPTQIFGTTAEITPKAGSDLWLLVQALSQARFSVVAIPCMWEPNVSYTKLKEY